MNRNPPTRVADAEGDKRRALKLAATASQRSDLAETSRNNAIRFAADAGASLREIAAATDLPHDDQAHRRQAARVLKFGLRRALPRILTDYST